MNGKKNCKKRNRDTKELESTPSFAAEVGYVSETWTQL